MLAMPQLALNFNAVCLDMFIQCNACKNTFASLSIFKDGSSVIFKIYITNQQHFNSWKIIMLCINRF